MGIDYGSGKTNYDVKNGIRFGIIPLSAIDSQIWYDESEPVYPENACPECGSTENVVDFIESEHGNYVLFSDWHRDEYACLDCEIVFDIPEIEATAFEYKRNGYFLSQSAESPDIWVFKSPFYTVAGFCSPCAPGAVYLTDSSPDAKGYCLGADWFELGKAPYKVFLVETGEEIPPAD